MVNSESYKQAAADILRVSAAGSDPATQQKVGEMCLVFAEFLKEFSNRTDGYMYLAGFHVAFDQIKKVIDAAEGQDRELIRQLVLAIIGSFGRTVQ